MIYQNSTNDQKTFNMIENYIYLHHTKTLIIIPQYPDSISDTMQSNFQSSSPIARSAPIFSYASSGPRVVQVAVRVHRDMMKQLNYNNRTLGLDINVGDDYVDTMIKQLQACALPRYATAQKMVDPPLVSVRWGTDIYCKGVISGAVTTTYSGPIIDTRDSQGNRVEKYAIIDIGFFISEVDPWDAESVMQVGGYRGISRTLERSIYRMQGNNTGNATLLTGGGMGGGGIGGGRTNVLN